MFRATIRRTLGSNRKPRSAGRGIVHCRQVWRQRVIPQREIERRTCFRAIRLRAHRHPRRSAVQAAVDFVAGPPAIKGRSHDRVRVLPVDSNGAESVPQAGGPPRTYRSDVSPDAGRGAVFPDSAVANALAPYAIGTGAISIGDVEVSVGAQRFMRGEESYRLASDSLPAYSAVDAAIESSGWVGYAHVDGFSFGTLVRGLKYDENHANPARGPSHGEGTDCAPGCAKVSAGPQAVVARSQVEDVVMLRVHGKAFP